MISILIFWAIWTQLALTALSRVIIAYKISLNHFQGRKIMSNVEKVGILRIIVRYHFGSILFGSLVLPFWTHLEYLLWNFCQDKA